MSAKRTIFPSGGREKQPDSHPATDDFEDMYTGHPGVEPPYSPPEDEAQEAARNSSRKGHAAYAAQDDPPRRGHDDRREASRQAGETPFDPMGTMPPFEPRSKGRRLGDLMGDAEQARTPEQDGGDSLSEIPADVLEREARARLCPGCPVKKDADDSRLRALAELDNAKKRMEREHSEQTRFAAEAVLSDILPSLDNLDLALQHASSNEVCKDFVTGVRMTRKLLDEALIKHGLQPVGAVGEEFNPAVHEAVGMHPDTNVPDGHVCALLSRGYKLNDRLLRPARVMVCRK